MDILASKNAQSDSLKDKRKLPVFIHSQLDDLPLSMEAFRVYCHLARRAGSSNTAWPSYKSIGEVCFRGSYPKSKTEVLRRKAIEAVKELIAWNLVTKLKRGDENEDGSVRQSKSNEYSLTDNSEWFQPLTLPSANTRGKKAQALPSKEAVLLGSASGTPGVVLGEHPPSVGGTPGVVLGEHPKLLQSEGIPIKKNPIEGNSRAAADFFNSGLDPEKESPTPLISKSQNVSEDTATKVDSPKDKSSVPACDNKTVANLETLKVYGFELTRQLEKLAAKYSEEEVQKSLKHLANCKKSQSIKNEPGWLTSCLEDKWYLSDSSLAQAQSSEGVEGITKEEAPKPVYRARTPEEERALYLADERERRENAEQFKRRRIESGIDIRKIIAENSAKAGVKPQQPTIDLREVEAELMRERAEAMARKGCS